MLTAENRDRRRGDEGTGEVESLHGRMKGKKMGDRVAKERPPEVRSTNACARILSQLGVVCCWFVVLYCSVVGVGCGSVGSWWC